LTPIAVFCAVGLFAIVPSRLALGGAPLAIAYKAINTLDSMVGYPTPRYRNFGWASARLDDLANYLPARITGLLMVFGAGLLFGRARSAWEILLRDGRKHDSPNAGIPEAAAHLGEAKHYQRHEDGAHDTRQKAVGPTSVYSFPGSPKIPAPITPLMTIATRSRSRSERVRVEALIAQTADPSPARLASNASKSTAVRVSEFALSSA